MREYNRLSIQGRIFLHRCPAFQVSANCDHNCTTATITVPQTAAVNVSVSGANGSDSVRVFVFTGNYTSPTYTGINGATDSTGHVTLNLPAGTYWFSSLMDKIYLMEPSGTSCTVGGGNPPTPCSSVSLQRANDDVTITNNITFGYDGLNRLTTANYSNPGTSLQYTYDAVGNRKQLVSSVSGTTTYNYDVANRLSSITKGSQTSNYNWDNNGNLQNIKNPDGTTAQTFTFDNANHLTAQSFTGGSTYSFAYNGDGDRISQKVGSTTTLYSLDLNSDLPQVLTDGSNLYLPGIGQSNTYGYNPQFYLTDVIGSTRLITDATGAIIGSPQNYDPFGNTTDAPSSFIGYTGQWKDASGLEYLRARYYDPSIGRFISKDPESGDINNPATMNGYNYANDNPINNMDPSGKDPCPPKGCGNNPVVTWNNMSENVLITYFQTQYTDGDGGDGCGPYSLAMAANLIQNNGHHWTGHFILSMLEAQGVKPPKLGIPASWFQNGVRYFIPNAQVEYHTDLTTTDLTDRLKGGTLSIVTISNEKDETILDDIVFSTGEWCYDVNNYLHPNSDSHMRWPTVGHYMVLVGYDFTNNKLLFLNPGDYSESKLSSSTIQEFESSWIHQPNFAIPSRSVTTIN